jgi:hypothetical protein
MMLHIFRKDVRRLWPGIVGSLVVLGALARQDRWRLDWGPGATEGYLNLLVPILWGCLVALAVEQDPIPGDRQFWITRPFRRTSLVGAKLLFALLFVHVPSVIADCYILGARGFSPLAYAPQLLTKQLVLACALTIPAMALASLVRSFSHFVLEVAAVAALFLVLAGPYSGPLYQWPILEGARNLLLVSVAAIAGAVILAAQYFGRRVLFSRVVGGAAGAGCALIFVLLLPPSALAIRATLSSAPVKPSLELAPAAAASYAGPARQVRLALPVRIAGLPPGTRVSAAAVRSELIGADGARYSETRPLRYNPAVRRTHDFGLNVSEFHDNPSASLVLTVDPTVFASLARGPVTLRGEVSLALHRMGQPVWLPVGARAEVAGAGRCMTRDAEDAFSGASRVIVECESPVHDVAGVEARLWDPRSGREWRRFLVPARGFMGPGISWLSPLYRDVAFVNVGERDGDWEIPNAAVSTAKVEITPRIPLGYAAVQYEFRDVDLTKYVARPGGGLTGLRLESLRPAR